MNCRYNYITILYVPLKGGGGYGFSKRRQKNNFSKKIIPPHPHPLQVKRVVPYISLPILSKLYTHTVSIILIPDFDVILGQIIFNFSLSTWLNLRSSFLSSRKMPFGVNRIDIQKQYICITTSMQILGHLVFVDMTRHTLYHTAGISSYPKRFILPSHLFSPILLFSALRGYKISAILLN